MTTAISDHEELIHVLDFAPTDEYRSAMTVGPKQCLAVGGLLHEMLDSILAERLTDNGRWLDQDTSDDRQVAALFHLRGAVRDFREHPSLWQLAPQRSALPEPVQDMLGRFVQLTTAMYAPLTPLLLAQAWVAHALQPDGEQTVLTEQVTRDYSEQVKVFYQEPDVQEQLRTIRPGPLQLSVMPPQQSVRVNGHSEPGWSGVRYDPETGTRAARRLAHVKVLGQRLVLEDRRLLHPEMDPAHQEGKALSEQPWARRMRLEARSFA